MLDFNAKPLLAALCGCVLSLTACDTPEKSEGSEYREWNTGQCVGTNSGATLSIGGKGMGPEPGDPDGGDPWREADWVAALQDDFRGHIERTLVANFEAQGGTEACETTCARARLGWDDGGGCIVRGDFSYGEVAYADKDRYGNELYSMDVDAEVEFGCVCSE